jgi:hypothetical protein
MTSINAIAAAEHQADLRRAAERWRVSSISAAPTYSTPAQAPTIALRLAQADEADLVRRLAALDDAPALEGQVLLALIDGEAAAALSLRDGRVVANPFVLTENAVALLRLREKHLSGTRRHRRWRAILRPRLAVD